MNNLSGGYIMVDLSSPNKVKQLEKAAALNKPLLVYYADGTTEWGKVAVTYETVDDVDIPTYHITTANGFVTVEADGDVSTRPLNVEGNGTVATVTGFTASYCKWSLSGTHLMFVLAGSVANGTTLTDGAVLASFELPDFIKNKIVAVWGDNYIERKANYFFADNWTSQTGTVVLGKFNEIRITQSGALTLTADRSFRIQFDLVIDNE